MQVACQSFLSVGIRKLQVLEIVPVSGHPELLIPYSELKVLERNGKKKFDEVLGDEVVELDVRDMLNGGVEGIVVLDVVIDAQGLTRVVGVKHSLGKELDESAVHAVGQWRFKPATRSGLCEAPIERIPAPLFSPTQAVKLRG